MTTLADIVATLEPLANSKVAASLLPVIVSSLLASGVALVTYRFKSKESLSASITWQWQRYQDGSDQEEPFLVVQNRSNIPAYLVGCRLLRGNFFKIESARNVLSYQEWYEGSFPLEIKAAGVTSFPLSVYKSDQALNRANLLNRTIGYLFKRNYIWIEARTLNKRRLIVPANDSSSWKKRPLWIELRWIPFRQEPWSFEIMQALKAKQRGDD